MEYSELIAKRHSVRSFQLKEVPRSLLEAMIMEARTAPSSKNCKSTDFLIVDDKETLRRIALMRQYGSAFVEGAAAAIVVMGDSTKSDLWVDNAAISATYLMLSAVDKGLGSCWVHVNSRLRFKHEAEKGTAEDYLREILDISPEKRILCVLALGYESKA